MYSDVLLENEYDWLQYFCGGNKSYQIASHLTENIRCNDTLQLLFLTGT